MTSPKILEAYPKDLGNVDRDKLTACIKYIDCSQTCTAATCAAAEAPSPGSHRELHPLR
jgi:hypothetical protein